MHQFISYSHIELRHVILFYAFSLVAVVVEEVSRIDQGCDESIIKLPILFVMRM